MPLVYFLFVWAVVSLNSEIQAQTDPLYDDWRWVQFTTTSGVPSNNINDIFETTTGDVWVRTSRGLAWYDGFCWRVAETDLGLPDGTIVSAKPGLNGDVLVVIDARFYRGNQNGFQSIPLVVDGDTLAVSDVLPLDAQRLMIFADQVVYQWDGDQITALAPLPAASLVTKRRYAVRSRSGRIWSLSSAGLYEWVNGTWQDKIVGRGFIDLEEGHSGELAFTELSSDQQGLWIWQKGDAPKFRTTATGLMIRDMDVAPNGDVVVGYASGQVEVRRNGVWYDLSPVPRTMLGLRCVRFMANGDLWVGSKNGLFWYRGSSTRWQRLVQENAGLKEQVISEILKTKNGDLWVASLGGIFVHHPNGSVTHFTHALDTPILAVTGLAEDDEGGVWLSSGGGFKGAFRWFNNAWQYFGRNEGLLASHYHRIVPDRQGQLWFLGVASILGGASGDPELGAFVYDGKTFTQWGPLQGLVHGRVYAFAQGHDGAFWFGTLGGLSRWHQGAWTHWTMQEGLKENRVFTLAIDQDGVVWFGHGQSYEFGLGYIDKKGKPHYLDVDDGLLDNRVWEVKSAFDGALWIGMRWGGIARYKDEVFASFGRDEGLGNLGVWPVLPLDDRVYVGTLNGVYQLNLGEAINPPPKIELAPPVIDVNRVVFRWQAFAFQGTLPEGKIETRYRIDEGTWSTWSPVREAGPLSLESGAHKFTVQAKGFLGKTDSLGTHVTFYIAPPFFKNPIFLGVLFFWGGSMIVLGVGYWRKQRRFLREIEDRNVELESEIFEHAQAEEKLRNSEDKFRQLLENIPFGIVLVDKDGVINLVNAQIEILFGYGRDELLNQNVSMLMPERFREKHLTHVHSYLLSPTQRPMGSNLSLAGRCKDGREFPVDISLGPVEIDNETLIIGIIVDVTDRETLAEQLRQSQKMEAVGKLAGGVAHDFNNLLTVINGYSDMLLMGVEDEHTRGQVEEIGRAGMRAAALTRQLLAFSRKQMLQPEILDPNAVLTDISEMLRRLIGEDIEFSAVYGAVGKIKADPGQLEQVLLNLAVNARDAMPQGGTLTIRTRNEDVDLLFRDQNDEVPPGSYVVISVSDTGVGMDEETQSQIFEPFFTTKEVGKGTGLGLSTVYGIVKQSEGYISVASEMGEGTSFNIYFNRVEDAGVSESQDQIPNQSYAGTETILLVEDEDIVRGFTRRVLDMNGYRVIDAGSGEEALDLCQSYNEPVDLLLTDVVMPRMSGRDVAEQMLLKYPNLRVLFMSGYTDDEIGQYGVKGAETEFLQKPFAPEDVLKKMREMLDA